MFSKKYNRNKPSQQSMPESGEQEQLFIPPVQAKLNIGKPGDQYEVEADKTADQIVNQNSQSNTVQATEEEEVQAKTLAKGLTFWAQKEELKEEEEVQMQEEEEEMLQTKAAGNRKNTTLEFEQNLRDVNSAGSGLNKETKQEMEAGFGADFSNVRIHTGSEADYLNKSIGARAFTHGKDIFFRQGNYDPSSKGGKHLLAHELTHTIQQGAIDASKPAGSHKKAGSIQRVPIDYRTLTWDDFNGPVDESSKYDAATASAVDMSLKEGYIGASVEYDGKKATVTISYDASKVNIKGIMETDESWKKSWITDDTEAEKKFGKDANFKSKRDDLLSHEQIHFQITNTISKSYLKKLKDVFPKSSYVESKETTEEGMESFLDEVLTKKGDELHALTDAVYSEADTEVDTVQDIYDKGTKHSQKIKVQKQWKDDFTKTLEAARKKAKEDAAAQSGSE